MKFLAIALACDEERFLKSYPPKGADLLRSPNFEISQLASLLSPRDQLFYVDERIDLVNFEIPFDLAFIYANFCQEKRAMELVLQLTEKGKRSILFGPLPTTWRDSLPSWVDSVVIGSILNAYPEIRNDLTKGELKKQYLASTQPQYLSPLLKESEKKPFYNQSYQQLQTIIGCFCLPPLKPFCPQYLYYGDNILKRNLIEVIGEIIAMPFKHITLLDDDITQYPEYYYEFFQWVWNYRKHWTVNAGARLFELTGFIRLLAKAGTRILFLNEDWFPNLFPGIITRENLKVSNESYPKQVLRIKRKQVKILHSERILVGAKMSLIYYSASEFDFDSVFKLIDRLDLDFLQIRIFAPAPLDKQKLGYEFEPTLRRYYPMLPSTDPIWLKNRFYTLGQIIYRIARRPFSLGFYNTLFYLIPYSLAYRQNFLEGIAYPP